MHPLAFWAVLLGMAWLPGEDFPRGWCFLQSRSPSCAPSLLSRIAMAHPSHTLVHSRREEKEAWALSVGFCQLVAVEGDFGTEIRQERALRARAKPLPVLVTQSRWALRLGPSPAAREPSRHPPLQDTLCPSLGASRERDAAIESQGHTKVKVQPQSDALPCIPSLSLWSWKYYNSDSVHGVGS